MILIDKPYVSDFLLQTAKDHGIPIIKTPAARQFSIPDGVTLMPESSALAAMRVGGRIPVYTSSENALGWVHDNLGFTGLPEKVYPFKDKLAFRRLVAPLYPDFFFREVRADEVSAINPDTLTYPFIIKPAVGFFSMGVYRVDDAAGWERTKRRIMDDVARVSGLYPKNVMNAATFIMEEAIEGEEYAIDAFFDEEGVPVITNIMHHVFPSGDDMRDRVYLTSKSIIEEHLAPFGEFLASLGRIALLKDFTVHVEVRVDDAGRIVPIEVNPMRFGGWCTTADLGWFAFGFNSYAAFFTGERPNWPELLKGKDDVVYAIVILDNSTGHDADAIAAFDYEKLAGDFEKPLTVRRVDYHEYPVFGFVFTETRADNMAELDRVLRSDLSEYVTLK